MLDLFYFRTLRKKLPPNTWNSLFKPDLICLRCSFNEHVFIKNIKTQGTRNDEQMLTWRKRAQEAKILPQNDSNTWNVIHLVQQMFHWHGRNTIKC